MTPPTCLNCAHRTATGDGIKQCLPLARAPGLGSWIINHWVSDETDQTNPCPYHKEAPMANADGNYTPNWPEGQTLADYDALITKAREARETWEKTDLYSKEYIPMYDNYLSALGPLVAGAVVESYLHEIWTPDSVPKGSVHVSSFGRVNLQAIVSARRAELAAAAKPSPQDTAKLTHEEDGSYTIVVPDATHKGEAYAVAQARGKTIGIPAWAWRKDHVYPNGDKRLDPEVYRYRTGTPASLEAQWRRLIEEGVLPKDDPRPLILGQATPTERRLRAEPPEALLRLLSGPDQALLKTIWPGYIARETDAQMADRWLGPAGSSYSASTIRRLRQRCNLPTTRAGSGVKAGRLPDICYETGPSTPAAPEAKPLPGEDAFFRGKPPTVVGDKLVRLLEMMGLADKVAGTNWDVAFAQMYAWVDSHASTKSTEAELSVQVANLEKRIHNQREELKKRTAQRPYPRIEKVRIYEGSATTNALLVFADGTEARLSVPGRTSLQGIVDHLREAGWTGVPPVAEFHKTYSGQYQYPEEEILIEIDSKRINPLADNLGLVKPAEGFYYKARDPFTAAALRRAGLPYRVPVHRGVVQGAPYIKWEAHTAIVIPSWGAK